MTERNETPTEQMTPCSEPNCIDMALTVLRAHPAATWRDEFSGLATDDLVIDRNMARHFADEVDTLRSTVATLTAERDEDNRIIEQLTRSVHAVKDAQIRTLTEQLREAREDVGRAASALASALLGATGCSPNEYDSYDDTALRIEEHVVSLAADYEAVRIECDAATAELARLRSEHAWQPIETRVIIHGQE